MWLCICQKQSAIRSLTHCTKKFKTLFSLKKSKIQNLFRSSRTVASTAASPFPTPPPPAPPPPTTQRTRDKGSDGLRGGGGGRGRALEEGQHGLRLLPRLPRQLHQGAVPLKTLAQIRRFVGFLCLLACEWQLDLGCPLGWLI